MSTRRIRIVSLLLILVCLFAHAAVWGERVSRPIRLAGGPFTPVPNVGASMPLRSGHFIVQFDHPLSESEQSSLRSAGLRLLEYLPENSYFATTTGPVDQIDAREFGLRWVGSLTVEQKLSPVFSGDEFPGWAIRNKDSVQVTVALHRDLDAVAFAGSVANRAGGRVLGAQNLSNAVELVVPKSQVSVLAAMDEISFVQPAMPPQVEYNDGCRAASKMDSAQAPPYSLTGSGIVVAMWDGGRADGSHPDLAGRVTSLDASGLTTHATHVAGTITGTGSQSSGAYKGAAPSATLLTQLWWNTSSEMATQYGFVISEYGAEISNNSWGVGVTTPVTNAACAATLGNYFVEDATIDDIVRGGAGAPISIVFAAGNMRSTSSQYCGSIGWTYNTIDPLASSKNVIAVGAVISNDNSMTTFSSWGPTDDGRVKPDICAPGCQIGGDGGVTSTKLTTGYTVQCGTSMAAPVVSGTIALMKQRWNQLLPSDSLAPSTIKGILINTASDRGNVGPDYQYGHGVLDAVAAVKKVGVGPVSYVEAAMITGVTHTYSFTVPPGTPKVRITLVWDDPGGSAISGNALINDLDLTLVDPASSTTLPWVLNPGSPNSPATRNADHLNNVETAEVTSPASGTWLARVTGFNIPEGPQKYSLVFSPDSINTTPVARAVKAGVALDAHGNPGATIPVTFWVRNTGGGFDSLRVRVTDSVNWLASTADSTIWLAPYDSAAVTRNVVIPSNAAPESADKASWLVTSKADTLVRDSSSMRVITNTYHALSSTMIEVDTAASPEPLVVTTWIHNFGNAANHVSINVTNDSGWAVSPSSGNTIIAAGDSTSFGCTLYIPAEVPHDAVSHVTVAVDGESSSSTSSTLAARIHNPLLPPTLILPDTTVYFTNRAPEFLWGLRGTHCRLTIAADTNLIVVVRSYGPLTDTTFDLPLSDSLPDGVYYWGVKVYSGSDSSSYQRVRRTLFIDNLPPTLRMTEFPSNQSYVNQQSVSLIAAPSGPAQPEVAPEYNRFELCTDSLFAGSVSLFSPIASDTFAVPMLLAEGGWYWRVSRTDSAGNATIESPFSSFVLDTTAPPTPALTLPQDTATIGGNPQVRFGWVPSPISTSPNYYRFQISSSISFDSLLVDTTAEVDTVSVARSMFTIGDTLYWKVQALDSAGWASAFSIVRQIRASSYNCGDMDLSGAPDIADVTALIGYLFLGGPPPVPAGSGSVDCEEGIDISDLSILIGYLYLSGPLPCCF